MINNKIQNSFITLMILVSFIFVPSTSQAGESKSMMIQLLEFGGKQAGGFVMKELFNFVLPKEEASFSPKQIEQFQKVIQGELKKDNLATISADIEAFLEDLEAYESLDMITGSPDSNISTSEKSVHEIRLHMAKLRQEDVTGKNQEVILKIILKFYSAKLANLKYQLSLREGFREELNYRYSRINHLKERILKLLVEIRSATLNTHTYISNVMMPGKSRTPYHDSWTQYLRRNRIKVHNYIYFGIDGNTIKNSGCFRYKNANFVKKGTLYPAKAMQGRTIPFPCVKRSYNDMTSQFKNGVKNKTIELKKLLIGSRDEQAEFFKLTSSNISDYLVQSCDAKYGDKDCPNGLCRNGRCVQVRDKNLACSKTSDCKKGLICSKTVKRCIQNYGWNNGSNRQYFKNEGERCELNSRYAKQNYYCKEGLSCINTRCVNPLNKLCYIGAKSCRLCANESNSHERTPHYCIENKDFNQYSN